ncbi:MAG: bifunctional oligoribonuclease/PAP phosphatase NrnA [Christensenellaceae bacterium]|jgi:phosphoesterase RecJ-like protein|nr:bifunctional oligoribonuclease/PAP phosphatase NrnA [Christensenellaceae bacterium]
MKNKTIPITDKTNFKNLLKNLKEAETIAITGHIRPDGDCIGSCLALAEVLRSWDKTTHVFIDGDIPENLSYLRGLKTINADAMLEKYDLLVILDLSQDVRLGSNVELRSHAKKIICIDHHLNPQIKSNILISNPARASTGEILFEFFLKENIPFDKDIAAALYTAIASDTGCFLFSNTTPFTHRAVARIMEEDLDIEHINFQNFRSYDPKSIPSAHYVLKHIRFLNKGRVSLIVLPYKVLSKYHMSHDDRHKYAKYGTDANGVLVSIFMTEQEPNSFNVSLRSTGNYSVASVAEALGGGGHKNAAGVTLTGDAKTVETQVLTEIAKILPQ